MTTKALKQATVLQLPDGSQVISTRRFVPEIVHSVLVDLFSVSPRKWLTVAEGAKLCYGSGRAASEKQRFRREFHKAKRYGVQVGRPLVGHYGGRRLERFKMADLRSALDRQMLMGDLNQAKRRGELGEAIAVALGKMLEQ